MRLLMAEGQLSERERQDRKMIVATVFGKIISIFIIMIVGVICCKMGIIDDYTKQRFIQTEYTGCESYFDFYFLSDGV